MKKTAYLLSPTFKAPVKAEGLPQPDAIVFIYYRKRDAEMALRTERRRGEIWPIYLTRAEAKK